MSGLCFTGDAVTVTVCEKVCGTGWGSGSRKGEFVVVVLSLRVWRQPGVKLGKRRGGERSVGAAGSVLGVKATGKEWREGGTQSWQATPGGEVAPGHLTKMIRDLNVVV